MKEKGLRSNWKYASLLIQCSTSMRLPIRHLCIRWIPRVSLYSSYESFHTVTYFAAYSDDAPTYSVDTCFRHISRTLLRRRVGIQYDIRVSVSSRLSCLTPTGGIFWKYLHHEFTQSIFFPNFDNIICFTW